MSLRVCVVTFSPTEHSGKLGEIPLQKNLAKIMCHNLLQKMWLYDWSEEGLEIQCIGDDILGKLVPPHVNIFYCFGGVVSLLLLFQIISGLGLTMYYSPSVVSAFSSVLNIVGQVHLGWLNRSIHRWSGSSMVSALILHAFRVYLTGGFKKARELIWMTGIILGVCTVLFGVTGY